MGMGEAIILIILTGGILVVPAGILYYATRAPDRAWKTFADRTGMDVEAGWGKFHITGRVRRIQVDIRARRQPGFFQMNPTMEGTATLPGTFPARNERISGALAAISNITTDFEIVGEEFRFKMTGTPAQISRVPILLEQVARVADAMGDGQP
jgi:hypothetical protein